MIMLCVKIRKPTRNNGQLTCVNWDNKPGAPLPLASPERRAQYPDLLLPHQKRLKRDVYLTAPATIISYFTMTMILLLLLNSNRNANKSTISFFVTSMSLVYRLHRYILCNCSFYCYNVFFHYHSSLYLGNSCMTYMATWIYLSIYPSIYLEYIKSP